MAKQIKIFNLRTFCVITGASKGYGQSLAINVAQLLPKNSFLLLLARSKEGLEKTKVMVQNKSPHVKIEVHPIDLGEQDSLSFDNLLEGIFVEHSLRPNNFQQAMLIHNAGSLGDVSKTMVEQKDSLMLKKYWDINLTSLIILNSVFVGQFRKTDTSNILVINISSICALQPFKSWSLYCAGKAARDMLFRTMAEENPDIRVLSWAPGPIDTDMQVEARTITGDKQLKDMFDDMKSQGKLLSCDQSAEKLMKLLQENTFHSGAHVDYYDL